MSTDHLAPAPRLLISAASHRSGSTLLQRYVSARSNTFVWGENGPFIPALLSALEGWPSTRQNEQEYRAVMADPTLPERRYTPNLSPPKQAAEHALRETILRVYRDVPDGFEGWGWKAIGYGFRVVKLLHAMFPEMRVVLLVRDPWDVARSVRRKGWIERRGYFQNMDEVADEWRRGAEAARRMADLDDPRFLLLRYEDLRDRLPDLNAFLGVADDTAREEDVLSRRLGTAPTVSRFRLTDDDVATVTHVCGEVASDFGYAAPTVEAER
jgi:hypothetical protein